MADKYMESSTSGEYIALIYHISSRNQKVRQLFGDLFVHQRNEILLFVVLGPVIAEGINAGSGYI